MIEVFGVVFLLIVFLVAVNKLDKSFEIFPELKRKILHIGLGLTSISFYWIFNEVWQVVAICLSTVVILLMIRYIPKLKQSLGRTLFDVQRNSGGDLLFPLSICLLFPLSAENPIYYIAPLSILTFSDSMAAIIGKFLGKKVFDVMGSIKSWEGTFAFSLTSFLIMSVLLFYFTPITFCHLLLISIAFAVLGALMEVISWRGTDNFFIPLGTYLFLQKFLNQTEGVVFLTLVLLIVLIVLGLVLGPKSQLNIHALLTAIVSVYLLGIVGGVAWIWPAFLVFLCHICLVKIQRDEATYTFNAVISITSAGLFWLMARELFQSNLSFFLYTSACANHLQMIVLLRLKEFRKKTAEPLIVLFVTLICGNLTLSQGLIYSGVTKDTLILYVSSLSIMFLGGVVLTIRSNRFSCQRWIVESLLAIAGSSSSLIPLKVIA